MGVSDYHVNETKVFASCEHVGEDQRVWSQVHTSSSSTGSTGAALADYVSIMRT